MRAVLPVLLVACAPGAPLPIPGHPPPEHPAFGGQSGEDPGADCEDEIAPGTRDDPLDGVWPFTAAELLAVADGAFTGVLAWGDGTETGLALDLDWGGEVRLVTGVGGPTCANRIEVDGTIGVTTADGLLAETAEATLIGVAGTWAWFEVDWDADTLAGALVLPDDGQIWSLRLSARADDTGVNGTLTATSRTGDTAGGMATETASGPRPATFTTERGPPARRGLER